MKWQLLKKWRPIVEAFPKWVNGDGKLREERLWDRLLPAGPLGESLRFTFLREKAAIKAPNCNVRNSSAKRGQEPIVTQDVTSGCNFLAIPC
jgi:hypothetical protein